MHHYRLAAAAAALALVAAGAPNTKTPGGTATSEMVALDVRVDGVPVLGSGGATLLQLISNATTQGDALAVIDALPAEVAGQEIGRVGVRSDGPRPPRGPAIKQEVGPVAAEVNPLELDASVGADGAVALLEGATGRVGLLGGAVTVDIDDVGITSRVDDDGSLSSQRLAVSGLRIDLGDLLDVEKMPLDVVLDILGKVQLPGDLNQIVKTVTDLYEDVDEKVETVTDLVKVHEGLIAEVESLTTEKEELETVLGAIDSVSGASFTKAQLDTGGDLGGVTGTVDSTVGGVTTGVDTGGVTGLTTGDDGGDTGGDTGGVTSGVTGIVTTGGETTTGGSTTGGSSGGPITDIVKDIVGDQPITPEVIDAITDLTPQELDEVLEQLEEDALLELEQEIRDTLFGVTEQLDEALEDVTTTVTTLTRTLTDLVAGLPQLVQAVTQLKLQLPNILGALAATPIVDTGTISLDMSAFAGPEEATTTLACEVSHLVVAGQTVEPPSCDSPEALKVLDARLEGLLGSLPLSAVPDVTLEFFNDAETETHGNAKARWARSHVTAMEFAMPSMSLGDLTDGLLADLAGLDLSDTVAALEQQLPDAPVDTSALTGAIDDVDPVLDQVQGQVADLLADLPLPDALKGLRLPGIAVTIDPTSTATWVADPDAAPVPPTAPNVPGGPDDPNGGPGDDPNGAPNPDDPNGVPGDPNAEPGPGGDLPVTGGGAGLLGLALIGGALELARRRR